MSKETKTYRARSIDIYGDDSQADYAQELIDAALAKLGATWDGGAMKDLVREYFAALDAYRATADWLNLQLRGAARRSWKRKARERLERAERALRAAAKEET